VRIVLGEGPHPKQAVEDPLALPPGDQAELGEPQGELAVGVAPRGEDEAGAGAVHRLERVLALLLAGAFRVLALRRGGEEHVLLVVVPVARAVPELDVEDLRGLDLGVPAGVELLAHLGLDQLQQDRAVRQPERHPGRLGAELEEVQLRTELAVVALTRLLESLQVLLEILLVEERRPVDAGQHLARLVAAPIGPGE
jgi:hypothetical protein